ncbi:unnamed protein product [Dracunculus medinensis]|uniref:G_PROTEIN_RECEP_F1_2 domain-containing protein n=1 Tax=Dracunculus medinensis TaxID=318479 RepID=A0A0N4U0F6_DRAME|nr:unnamed protein product [Dracunculus medinensis]
MGVATNTLAICTILISSQLHNAFGYISTSQSTANIVVSLIFCFWAAPLALNPIPGHLILFFWWVALFSHFAIACNRLIAVTRPIRYAKIFSTRNTKIVLIFVWAIPFLYSLIYEINGCNFYFNRLTLKWEYSETACGQMLSTYIDVIICYMMIISVLTIDITTYILMKRFNSHVRFPVHCPSDSNFTVQKVANNIVVKGASYIRRKKEISFYIQACCSISVYLVTVIFFYGVEGYIDSPIISFYMSTFLWEIVHMIDGSNERSFPKMPEERITTYSDKPQSLTQSRLPSLLNPPLMPAIPSRI